MNFYFQRSYRGPIQAVILDWAGTTVDFGSFAPAAVFQRLFESRGVTITPEDARSGMGLMKKDHLKAIFARPAVSEAWRTVHGAQADETIIEDLFQNFIPMQISTLVDYAAPIPGMDNLQKDLRKAGIKIGSTTGYLRSMMNVLAPAASQRGYKPDCIVCPDDVPAGRPYPWMCYQNAMNLGVYPLEAIVKVGDTIPDIEEGLNAGMWSVGISLTGTLLGLTADEFSSLDDSQRKAARERIEPLLSRAGAHFVIDGIWDLPVVLEEIRSRLMRGERP